jgi:hypothetical protein
MTEVRPKSKNLWYLIKCCNGIMVMYRCFWNNKLEERLNDWNYFIRGLCALVEIKS